MRLELIHSCCQKRENSWNPRVRIHQAQDHFGAPNQVSQAGPSLLLSSRLAALVNSGTAMFDLGQICHVRPWAGRLSMFRRALGRNDPNTLNPPLCRCGSIAHRTKHREVAGCVGLGSAAFRRPLFTAPRLRVPCEIRFRRVFVFDAGRVVEEGTPEKLMAQVRGRVATSQAGGPTDPTNTLGTLRPWGGVGESPNFKNHPVPPTLRALQVHSGALL